MSKKIETGHGAVGLLMVECEQLRRERNDLLQRCIDLEKALAVAIEVPVQHRLDECEAELEKAKAENARLAAALERAIADKKHALATLTKECQDDDMLDCLSSENEILKSENARLADQIASAAESYSETQPTTLARLNAVARAFGWMECSQDDTLCDLLAPTISLLAWMAASDGVLSDEQDALSKEITRLRGLTKPSDGGKD